MKDDGEWEIVLSATTRDKCKHCSEQVQDDQFELVWRIPRAVQAWNEGGYNSTVVCVDCILEAANAS